MSWVKKIVKAIGLIDAVLVIPVLYNLLALATYFVPVDLVGLSSLIIFGQPITLLVAILSLTLLVLPITALGLIASKIVIGAEQDDVSELGQWCLIQGILIGGAVYLDDLDDPLFLTDPKVVSLLAFKALSIPIVLYRIYQIL